mgnify:CR=1 FL=1
MRTQIDLNADLGEGCANDAELMALVSSCNIACGGHAGDDASMRAALLMAQRHDVSPGAHPSYPDREGFGRGRYELDTEQLRMSLDAQVGALADAARQVGMGLSHLKPHGTLYHDAASDPRVADLIAALAGVHLPGAALVGPPDSAVQVAARDAGLAFLAEGFVDRRYAADGSLLPRSDPRALLSDPSEQAIQAIRLARGGPIETAGGPRALEVDTLCLHGDAANSVVAARTVRWALEDANITVRSPHVR